MNFFLVLLAFLCMASGLVYAILKSREMQIWILNYARHSYKNWRKPQPEKTHIMFCFVDHYEPGWKTDDVEVERSRVDRWMRDYPSLASKHQDADGVHPQHTFFYPEEEYRKEHLDKIQALCELGYGEVEIHIHHFDDTEANFREVLQRFKKTLVNDHKMLSVDPQGNVGFAFIHGNWTLDNCHPDGLYCGINNEIDILQDEGCFVDMTLPSAPSPTQTTTVNSIYMATDDVEKPKSHDKGDPVAVNKPMLGDLLMVQGPLCLNWKQRKFGIIPKIENGDVRRTQPAMPERMDSWVKQRISVEGRDDWVFIKIHTHGTQDEDMDALLGRQMDEFHTYIEKVYNDGEKYVLHYVTARELYNIVKAASDGKAGNPNAYRDYWYKKIA